MLDINGRVTGATIMLAIITDMRFEQPDKHVLPGRFHDRPLPYFIPPTRQLLRDQCEGCAY